jgi:predicted O-linked N-acetylglucosamine transferase (SPINDLY family)
MTMVMARHVTPTQRVQLEAALAAEGRAAEAYNADDFAGAITHFLEAQRLGLNHAMLHAGLGTAYLHLGQRRRAIAAYRAALQRGCQDPKVLNNVIFLLDHEPGTTLEMALEVRKAWWRQFGAPLRSSWRSHGNDADPERPLRIGYVSGDFRLHSASMCFGPVVMRHSEGYRPICYHTKPAEDQLTALFAEGVTEFHRVHDLDEAALAARIRADRIDILVDLSAFSSGGRLLAFCRRPAPIQVTGWGYATGTGLPVMDGFFADEVTVPRHFATRGYTEPILYLPSIVPFTWPAESGDVGELPALTRGVFTFGSFNRLLKITPDVLDTWAEILAAVPDSRLLLKQDGYERAEVQAEVRGALQRRGVDPLRLICRGLTGQRAHFDSYGDVDVALDPFPHTGGVTALEGLWHGVPPLTLMGERVPERLSASFCSTLGLQAFITSSRDDYIQTAVHMGTEFRPQLAQIRATLRARMATSPLCVGYAHAVEAHYRELWRGWCRRQAA